VWALKLKDAVRKAEGLDEGDTVTVRLTPTKPKRSSNGR
jgi:hypothetical protein